jgi:hypothetical protein
MPEFKFFVGELLLENKMLKKVKELGSRILSLFTTYIA